MPSQTLNFNVSYTVDSTLVWSVEELICNYLTDIPLQGLGGERMSNKAIENKIRIATEQLEGFLSVKIPKQRLIENQDFEREHFVFWGAIKTNYLITEPHQLIGRFSLANQIVYPLAWLSVKRSVDKSRMIYIIPGQQIDEVGGVKSLNFNAIFTSKFPIYGIASENYVPNYWKLDYSTGFEKVPADLQDAISKFAVMQILAILGDITFGAGIANTSLSLDGLSQSIGTTQSAENSLYSARVRQFQSELKTELKWLKNKYAAFNLVSL